ncbi:hypothetical protein RhiJN_25363 [Ceratobasidium sp. AG-Ba]|nr:hypothetical protein RhiJN_11189 [Ceratobasidium sp. AG-Ba]QRV97344.1 hypothetical protein RhiJN_25363 [Ceratobasidium sp. AG-Ba]QRW11896.1 hypothetical protein RhiLY_10895 [Ceratobasidium sp. AG-Ba]
MLARIAARSTLTTSARVAAIRATAARFYSEDQFGRKEAAHENEYIRKHQAEQLKKLKEDLAKQQAAVNDLEKQIQEGQGKPPKK